MESEQNLIVYPAVSRELEDGDSDSDFERRENDVIHPPAEVHDEDDDPEDGDLNSPSTSSLIPISALTIVPETVTASCLEITTPVTASVTVAFPSASAVTATQGESVPQWQRVTEIVQQKPQIDDSRRLFQRLWTDEDEIELLRGFLEYTTLHRASGSSHPPDTGPFYEQIKSKLQLDFNKNQLMEKLRRLKKKYRNVMSKIHSGKEIFFKSPHDQATFEISRKIWNHTGKIIGFEDTVLDVEETSNNHHVNNTNNNNLNVGPNANVSNFDVAVENGIEKKVVSSNSTGSKKRSRSKLGKIEEEKLVPGDGFVANIANNNSNNDENVGGGGDVAGIIEETLRSCLSSGIKEMLNGTAAMMMNSMGGLPWGGVQGMAAWRPMVMLPHLGFEGMGGHRVGGSSGGGAVAKVVEERWRKQQILELEVYSRRLELVQDHIRAALDELRSMPGGGGG